MNSCNHYVKPIAFHIPEPEPTGRINVDYRQNDAVWNNTPYGAQTVIKNKSTGVTYSVSQNPDFLYAYRTSANLPYGTYEVTVNTGNGRVTREITLNATNVWLGLDYYTLTYYGNGATSGTAPAQQIRLQGQVVNMPNKGTLAKSGYTFCYWFDPSAPTKPIASGTNHTVEGKMTLQARWLRGNYALGDVNGDGVIDTADATLVLQYSGELIELSPAATIRADYNADGVVDTTDAILILQAAAGIS